MTSTSLVKYGSYSIEECDRDAAEMSASEFYKVKEGENIIRVPPPPPGKTSPIKIVDQHRIEMGDGRTLVFICPGTGCPACAKFHELRRSRDSVVRDMAFETFKPRRRAYMNVIDRENPERGPIVWEFGKTVIEDIKKIRSSTRGGGDFTHPEKGFDLIVDRVGTGKNDTKYKVIADRQCSPLGDMSWIEKQVDLDEFCMQKSLEEIEDIIAEFESGNMQPVPARRAVVASQSRRLPVNAASAKRRTIQDDVSDATLDEDDDIPV